MIQNYHCHSDEIRCVTFKGCWIQGHSLLIFARSYRQATDRSSKDRVSTVSTIIFYRLFLLCS